jgi:cyclopropane-fatty-acyl-phospholipid synthase
VVATNRHYDLPAEVFATFLDPTMKYTCGLYRTGNETLDQAQHTKLHYITQLLHLTGGEHVLDIGCGWGSLTLHLATHHHCHITAITPSPTQATHLRERVERAGLTELVEVVGESVYDVDLGRSRFDAVAMVGVIEHMPDHQAVLATAARHLRRGGRLYVSASCYRNHELFDSYADRPGSRHVTDGVFGYGVLRPLSSLLAAAEDAGLSMTTVLDLTSHYHRTIEEWAARLSAGRGRVDELVPGLADDLLRYFRVTNTGWGYTTKHYAFTAVRDRMGRTETLA